jgi:hypothetical protein
VKERGGPESGALLGREVPARVQADQSAAYVESGPEVRTKGSAGKTGLWVPPPKPKTGMRNSLGLPGIVRGATFLDALGSLTAPSNQLFLPFIW